MPYKPGDTHHKQAYDIWPILTAHLELNTRQSLAYRTLAKSLGRDESERHRLTTALDLIGEYCRVGGLPFLNVIVVFSETGAPISGFPVHFNLEREREFVFNFDWSAEPRPAMVALANLAREGV